MKQPLICQLLTSKGFYRFMKSTIKPIWYEGWNLNETSQYYHPVLLSCRIPSMERVVRVSITTKPCKVRQNPTFNIKHPSSDNRRNFTVCIKPLDFRKDISLHLIQWIEILRILGVDRMEFYVKHLKKETLKVLKWLVLICLIMNKLLGEVLLFLQLFLKSYYSESKYNILLRN